MPEETCWTLIRAAAEGREEERDEFARRYLPLVRRVLSARWRGTPLAGQVEDAAQDVFLTCFGDGTLLERAQESREGFRAFLFGVTRNVARRTERTSTRREARLRPRESVDPASPDSGLSRLFDREYARSIVSETLRLMAERAAVLGQDAEDRLRLLERRFEGGLAVREIAASWRRDARELHLEQAKAIREFRSALRQVVGLAERCAPEHVDRACADLLAHLE